jgi:hypothetical protein
VLRLHGEVVTQFNVGLYLLSYDCLDGDNNILIIVNVKYNYLSRVLGGKSAK